MDGEFAVDLIIPSSPQIVLNSSQLFGKLLSITPSRFFKDLSA
ncbi:MAG: hypothetical protein ACP5LZ_04570 [Fervidicoccaceae archaeon]|jgi:hypothetical protein